MTDVQPNDNATQDQDQPEKEHNGEKRLILSKKKLKKLETLRVGRSTTVLNTSLTTITSSMKRSGSLSCAKPVGRPKYARNVENLSKQKGKKKREKGT